LICPNATYKVASDSLEYPSDYGGVACGTVVLNLNASAGSSTQYVFRVMDGKIVYWTGRELSNSALYSNKLSDNRAVAAKEVN
jgi:hypothetical protein